MTKFWILILAIFVSLLITVNYVSRRSAQVEVVERAVPPTVVPSVPAGQPQPYPSPRSHAPARGSSGRGLPLRRGTLFQRACQRAVGSRHITSPISTYQTQCATTTAPMPITSSRNRPIAKAMPVTNAISRP